MTKFFVAILPPDNKISKMRNLASGIKLQGYPMREYDILQPVHNAVHQLLGIDEPYKRIESRRRNTQSTNLNTLVCDLVSTVPEFVRGDNPDSANLEAAYMGLFDSIVGLRRDSFLCDRLCGRWSWLSSDNVAICCDIVLAEQYSDAFFIEESAARGPFAYHAMLTMSKQPATRVLGIDLTDDGRYASFAHPDNPQIEHLPPGPFTDEMLRGTITDIIMEWIEDYQHRNTRQ